MALIVSGSVSLKLKIVVKNFTEKEACVKSDVELIDVKASFSNFIR